MGTPMDRPAVKAKILIVDDDADIITVPGTAWKRSATARSARATDCVRSN